MTISSIKADFVGEIGVSPRLVRLVSNDLFAVVTAQNYLSIANCGIQIFATDYIFAAYGVNSTTQTLFLPTIDSSGNITLSAYPEVGNAIHGSVTANHIAAFYDTIGTLKDGGVLGTAAAAAISSAVATVAGVSGATTIGNIVKNSDITGTLVDGGLAANKIMTSSLTTPDVAADIISFNVTCGQAALASAGSVALITSSGSKQYRIITLKTNSGGTNFSGGGGDRLGQITDGTTVYSVIPATNMQTLVNAQWGVSTPLPNPASAPLNTATVAGANLSFKYSGGTTDYTSGSITITGTAERIA